MQPLNIVFAGTPEFGLPSLKAISQSKHNIIAIYSQPDRPAGRGRKIIPSPIKQWGLSQDIPVFQPVNFKAHNEIDHLKSLNPDIMVVIAYGLLLPETILNIPKFGCINVHASLLPRWRGASPIVQPILHGEQQTGISIMQLDKGMDTGPVFTQKHCYIGVTDNAKQLHDRLADLAPEPLLETLDAIASHKAKAISQDNLLATHAPKIQKQDAAINWQQSAQKIERQVRAYNPWPIAHTTSTSSPIRIHEAHIGDTVPQTCSPGTVLNISSNGIYVATGSNEAIIITRLQFPGGKVLDVKNWVNGPKREITVGDTLT